VVYDYEIPVFALKIVLLQSLRNIIFAKVQMSFFCG